MTPEGYENGRLYVKTFPETGKKLIFPTTHDSFAATKNFCCFLSWKFWLRAFQTWIEN